MPLSQQASEVAVGEKKRKGNTIKNDFGLLRGKPTPMYHDVQRKARYEQRFAIDHLKRIVVKKTGAIVIEDPDERIRIANSIHLKLNHAKKSPMVHEMKIYYWDGIGKTIDQVVGY
jgi:hypothetical protein